MGVWEFQGKNCFCCACANAPPSYRPYIVLELIRDEEMLALREQLPQAVQAIENVVSVATADASKLVDFIANMDTTLSAAVAEASSSVNAAVQAEVDEAKALLDGVVTQVRCSQRSRNYRISMQICGGRTKHTCDLRCDSSDIANCAHGECSG